MATLLRIINGDDDSRHDGLLDSVERLSKDVSALRTELQAIKARRPNVWVWTAGYVCFLISGLFAGIAIYNVMASVELFALLDIPVVWAWFLALAFAGAALIMFVVGYGWQNRL